MKKDGKIIQWDKRIVIGVLLLLTAAACFSAYNMPDEAAQRAQSIQAAAQPTPTPEPAHIKAIAELRAMMDADPSLAALTEKSIKLAAQVNPDKNMNPVQSLNELYGALEHVMTCMPWNVLSEDLYPDIFTRIDQSIDYIWFLFDQPLPELAGMGYYYPSLQYHEPLAGWLKTYSKTWGSFLDTEESWNDDYYNLALKEERFGLGKGWYASSNVWKTFNEFFARRLSDPSVRPIGSAAVVSPADSTPQGIWSIDADGHISTGLSGTSLLASDPAIKSSVFRSVKDLIGADSEYADKFSGGTLTHTFLNVDDYHRYHFPVSGTVLEVRKIDAVNAAGGVTVWDEASKRYVLLCSNIGWQMIETRDCLIMDTEEFGLVAILPIGMSQISSCNWEPSVVKGAKVNKGDPMGYFLFGGSDIVMVFQEGVDVKLCAEPNADGTYPHVLMGENYAEIKKAIKN